MVLTMVSVIQMDYDCFISISKSAWPDSIMKTGLLGFLGISNKLMGPEPVTFFMRDLTYMVLCEDNNGHKEAQTTWVPAGEDCCG